jgi:phosphopantetheinyl transferase (holo-ACP synthase)
LAAALLWAAKEAAVKALGLGFHHKDPLDIEVVFLSPARAGLELLVQTPEAVSAWVRPLENGWLALAVA